MLPVNSFYTVDVEISLIYNSDRTFCDSKYIRNYFWYFWCWYKFQNNLERQFSNFIKKNFQTFLIKRYAPMASFKAKS